MRKRSAASCCAESWCGRCISMPASSAGSSRNRNARVGTERGRECAADLFGLPVGERRRRHHLDRMIARRRGEAVLLAGCQRPDLSAQPVEECLERRVGRQPGEQSPRNVQRQLARRGRSAPPSPPRGGATIAASASWRELFHRLPSDCPSRRVLSAAADVARLGDQPRRAPPRSRRAPCRRRQAARPRLGGSPPPRRASFAASCCRRATMSATGRNRNRERIQMRMRTLTVWSASVHQSMRIFPVG